LEDNGETYITDKIGLNATGHPFNSVLAIEERPDHLQNPLVNAGAIQISSTIKGKNSNEKWQRVLAFMQQLSDGKPYLGETVYQSETATNQHNRAIAELLQSYNMMSGDTKEILDLYTRDCSVMVTAKQLAIMGATLANGGINPMSHQRIIAPQYVRDTLSQMVTNGLYETSGAWWWKVGLPAKSGVGGGIIAIVPNKMAIAVFSPPLDKSGNSVRAQAAIEELSRLWKLHMLN
jgi:glutaminase